MPNTEGSQTGARAMSTEGSAPKGQEKMMERHFVTFYSPGTFVPEQTTQEIGDWNVDEAVTRARGIKERHGATPYCFRFSTRRRGPDDLDSKQAATSGFYFLGGRVLTLADVELRNDPSDRVLISNMRNNDITRVVENTNSWKVTVPLRDNDVVLALESSGGHP